MPQVRSWRYTLTYVVGFRQPGLNAIIADVRMTLDDHTLDDPDMAVKTGVFFPGCLYGVVGNATEASQFISEVRESLNVEMQSAALWDLFERIADGFSPTRDKKRRFRLLLSSRLLGQPTFYEFDSFHGLSRLPTTKDYQVYTRGSGKRLLDGYVLNLLPQLKGTQDYLLKGRRLPSPFVHEVSPYLLCLWLSEFSLTVGQARLGEIGVGGEFHFMYQTCDGEGGQKPAVYIFSNAIPISKTIYSWWYRVARAGGGLYVERWPPPDQSTTPSLVPRRQKRLFFDATAYPAVDIAPHEMLVQDAQNDLDSQPFWFFCGIGFPTWSRQSGHYFLASTKGQREELIAEDGSVTPKLQKVIVSAFTGEEIPGLVYLPVP